MPFPRLDAWVNTLTGLGGLRDKVQAYVFNRQERLDDETLEAMYDEDDMACRIADAVPEHMMRRGVEVETEDDPSVGEKVVSYIESLEGFEALTDAMVWERVFGGGVVVVGADDGRDVSEPLDYENIQSIRFLNVLDRRDCVPIYWYSDPSKRKYGRPETYRITYLIQGAQRPREQGPSTNNRQMSLEVHETRLLVFRGARSTVRNRLRYGGWGTPLLSRLRGPLRTFHGNWQAVENMMQDASQGVYAVKGLFEAIAGKKLDALETRMQMIDMGRSVARAIMVDADGESFERKDTSMSGLPDLLDRSGNRLSSSARMPTTVLMGTSPAGLNATGASDLRNWYDELEAQRTVKVLPKIRRLVKLVMLAKDGPTRGRLVKHEVTMPSMWQETDDEKATTMSNASNAIVALVQGQVISREEGALNVTKFGVDLDTDSRTEAIEAYNKKLASGEGDFEEDPTPLLTDPPKGPPSQAN